MKKIIKNIFESNEQMEFPRYISGFQEPTSILMGMRVSEYVSNLRAPDSSPLTRPHYAYNLQRYADYLIALNGEEFIYLSEICISTYWSKNLIWIGISGNDTIEIGVYPVKSIPICIEGGVDLGLSKRSVLYSQSSYNTSWGFNFRSYYTHYGWKGRDIILSDEEFEHRLSDILRKHFGGLKI